MKKPMNYGQKSKIKKLVNSLGFRISESAFDGIDRLIENIVNDVIEVTKENNMKTVDINHTQVTTKSNSNTHVEELDDGSIPSVYGRPCKRCSNVHDAFLKKAREEQVWMYDEAQRIGRAFSKGKQHDPHWATRQDRVNNII